MSKHRYRSILVLYQISLKTHCLLEVCSTAGEYLLLSAGDKKTRESSDRVVPCVGSPLPVPSPLPAEAALERSL